MISVPQTANVGVQKLLFPRLPTARASLRSAGRLGLLGNDRLQGFVGD